MSITMGIDLTDIAPFARLLDRHGARFLDRIYTPREQKQCGREAALLACLFAAKEAVAKVLGTGLNYLAATGVDLREMEIIAAGPRGPSQVWLHGAARIRAAELALHEWSVSFAHSRTYALAMVIAWPGAGGFRRSQNSQNNL
ncbi:MAG: 4'-phosphopantetheinyl transferase superfamily protein [Oscillochloridaceae bacterium]|nr:4'-phosphopantetheinyl transferase superfamily protein [Chloroflexaceae bacterium]MDW8389229.1 4'-phosphopantetheinyl transferase superfamily protein [Oscillochloridaceae bacterium]